MFVVEVGLYSVSQVKADQLQSFSWAEEWQWYLNACWCRMPMNLPQEMHIAFELYHEIYMRTSVGCFIISYKLVFSPGVFRAGDIRQACDVIYLDFSKAFDLVSHKRLI